MKVMFDTNVFNHIVEGRIQLDAIPSDWEPVATHLQHDEILKTPDSHAAKREALLKLFADIVKTNRVATESIIFGVSRFGGAKFSGPKACYTPILETLNQIRKKPNNTIDALIAETCIINDYLLVTNDGPLKSAAEVHGGRVHDLLTDSSA